MTDRDRSATGRIERELQGEKANALKAAIAALEDALAALRTADAALAAPGVPPPGLAARRHDLFAEAAERLWWLVVQREAMGLVHHDIFLEALAVPRAVRRAMGPRARRR